MSKIARRYTIRGRVQGVGFRWFVEVAAQEIGVTGWVRNLDDGRVEVYAVGDKAQLEQLNGRLWRGPMWSDVRGVEVMEAPVEKRAGFRITT